MNQDRFAELVDGLCEGRLDAAGAAELDAMVAADPALARKLDAQWTTHRLLASGADLTVFAASVMAEVGTVAVTPSVTMASRRRAGSRRAWRPYALAAGLLIAALVLFVPGPARVPPRLAVVTAAESVHDQAEAGIAVGRELRAGERLVVVGRLKLDWFDGSTIELGPGSSLRLPDRRGGSLALESGRLQAEVVPQAPGAAFVIRTSAAEAVVVGTSLVVEVGDGTRLEVRHGLVRFVRLADAMAVEVAAGSWAEVHPGRAFAAHADAASGDDGPVRGFTLIDADRDQPIPGFVSVRGRMAFSLSELPTRNLNLRTETAPGVDRITYVLSPKLNRPAVRTAGVEQLPPFSLAGDRDGDYFPWTPAVGEHRIEVIPSQDGKRGGKVVLEFVVRP